MGPGLALGFIPLICDGDGCAVLGEGLNTALGLLAFQGVLDAVLDCSLGLL